MRATIEPQLQSDNENEPRKPVLSYTPALDGLRAISVLAVLLYHAELAFIPGGFLGVEVFFVISGFLITALLLQEREETGGINLLKFWFRRARRLLPALYFLLAGTIIYALLFLPSEVASLRGDSLAAFTYVTNWYLIFENKSYFEFVGRPSLLQHLWSLAVEEQFYLFWPPLLVLLLKFLGRGKTLLLVMGGALFSTVLMVIMYQPSFDPSRVYYGTDTRATGLLVGAALAFIWSPWKNRNISRVTGFGLDLVGFAAIFILILDFISFTEYSPWLYRGGFLIVGLATALAIATAVHPGTNLIRLIIGNPVLRWVGLRSYSIYLWHWPVFTVTRPNLDIKLDGIPLLTLRFAITLVLAEISYRFIETPVRKGIIGRTMQEYRNSAGEKHSRLRLVGLGTAVMVVFMVAGIALLLASKPAPPQYLAELITSPAPTTAASVTQPVVIPTLLATATPERPTPTLASVATPTIQPTVTIAPTLNKITATTIPLPTSTPVPPTQTPVPTKPPQTTAAVPAPISDILAIGDSVMLGSANDLKKAISGIEVDATVSRSTTGTIELVRDLKKQGKLGQILILHVGSNNGLYDAQFDEIMKEASGLKKVIFINVKVPRRWEEPTNTTIQKGVKRYPNTAMVDWYSASNPHPELFWDDGIHPRPEGRVVYANLVAACALNGKCG
jgi:peptidoglycan/LPS O-acetylase OafA/YrhL